MMRLKKVILCLLLPFLILGCSPSKNRLTDWLKGNGKLKVLSTTSQVGDLVTTIGGDRVDNWVLIQGELDPHSYEIVKGDLEKLDRADVIIYNGLGLEHGASLSSILESSPKSMALGGEISSSHPNEILMRGQVIDPHIWMDISLWKEGIAPIIKALSVADPEGAESYAQRGRELAEQMEVAHLEVLSLMQNIPSDKRYLVTSHDAFHYFAKKYLADPGQENWENRVAAPEGLAPEGQLSPRDIEKIIQYLRVTNISVLFPESNVSRDSIRKIAIAGKELGHDVHICTTPLYGDTMGELSYLEMMKHNAATIANHLCNTQ